MRLRPNSRPAFTLIEMLVVIAIVGLLATLTTMGVQAARDAARRATCQNNLRQVGLALSSFHAAHGHFPPASRPQVVMPNGMIQGGGTAYSALFQLLPYLEQKPLYDSFNVPLQSEADIEKPDFNRYPHIGFNETAARTRLEGFLCPSDNPLAPGTNYLPCSGPYPLRLDLLHERRHLPAGGGAFPGFTKTAARDFADGLSQTVGFSERITGGGAEASFDPRRDIWFSGLIHVNPSPTSDEMARACKAAGPPASRWWTGIGEFWVVGYVYNHVAPPNPQFSDCAVRSRPRQAFASGAVSARSFHGSVVNTLLMDGSVRTFSDTIDIRLWRALATRSGGEPVKL